MCTSKEYRILFNAITDSVIELEKAVQILKDAQLQAEALLVDSASDKDEKQIIFQRKSALGTG